MSKAIPISKVQALSPSLFLYRHGFKKFAQPRPFAGKRELAPPYNKQVELGTVIVNAFWRGKLPLARDSRESTAPPGNDRSISQTLIASPSLRSLS